MSLIRLKWVADDGREFDDPPEFRKWWLAQARVADPLTPDECLRLWAYAGRIDRPPQSLMMLLNRGDVEGLWPSPHKEKS